MNEQGEQKDQRAFPGPELTWWNPMARGWESKSVEDQIGAAEAAEEDRAKLRLSQHERVQETQRQSLLLSRAQVVTRLKTVTNARYRAQLERSLEHLDKQLSELGPGKE